MKNKLVPAIGVAVAIAVGVFVALSIKPKKTVEQPPQTAGNTETEKKPAPSSTPEVATTTPKKPAPAPAVGESQATFSSGEEMDAPDILVVQVSFDGEKFSPETVDIKQGDIVIFKNNSKVDFWPASNQHPLHGDYPEFDPKKPIPAGGRFQFKFDKVGNWKYHDHLSSFIRGTVNVTAR